MTPYQAGKSLLRTAWYTNPATTPAAVKHDAAVAISAATQTLWSSKNVGDFAKQTLSFSTDSGVDTYTLPTAIQPYARSIENVRCNNRPLIEYVDATAFETREDAQSHTLGETMPRFFYVYREYLGASNTAAEARATKLMLGPTPIGTYAVSYLAILEPPQYDAFALEVDSGAIPMPDSKVESLLLPLAGWYFLRSPFITNPEVRKTLREQGEIVLAQIGMMPSKDQKEDAP